MKKTQRTPPSVEKEMGLLAKGLAILAVVLLHSLSLFPDSIYTSSDFKFVFILINQATRFSVPLFLALSGFGLTRKYLHTNISIITFMKKRIKKLLPLYLFWSVILFIIFSISNTWFLGNNNLWQGILMGNIDYHLYFVPLIFQFYLLFSFFPTELSKRKIFSLLLITGVLQILLFFGMKILPQYTKGSLVEFTMNDQIQYRILINWSFYFILGIFLARINLNKIRSHRLYGPSLLTILMASLAWTVYEAQQLINSTNNIVFATSFTRPAVFFYATTLILSIIIYGPVMLQTFKLDLPILQKIGKNSFIIYLSHTLVLRIVQGLITNGPRLSTITLAGVLWLSGTIISSQFS